MSTPPWGEQPADQSPQPPPPPSSPYQPYAAPGGSPYGSYPVAPQQQTNGLAIASLVISIGSVLVCCGFPGIVGAIMGHVARKQAREQNQSGEGMALAGIIVGWIGFGLAVAGAIFYFVLIVGLGVWSESVDCYTDSDGTYVCD